MLIHNCNYITTNRYIHHSTFFGLCDKKSTLCKKKSNKQSLTPLSNFNDQINFPVAVRVYESGVKLA